MTKKEVIANLKSGKKEAIITSMRLYWSEVLKIRRPVYKQDNLIKEAEKIFSSA